MFLFCVTAIQTSKEHEIDEGFADVIEKGWLIKEGANDDSRRKRQVINSRILPNIFKQLALERIMY